MAAGTPLPTLLARPLHQPLGPLTWPHVVSALSRQGRPLHRQPPWLPGRGCTRPTTQRRHRPQTGPGRQHLQQRPHRLSRRKVTNVHAARAGEGPRDRRQAPFSSQSQRPEASSIPRAQALRAPQVDPKCGLVGQAGQGPGANPLGQQSPGGGGAVPRLRLQVQLAAAGKSPAGSGPARSRVLTRG